MESKESQYFELPNFAQQLRIGNYYEWFHEEHSTYHKADADFIKTQFEYDTDPDADQFSRGWWASPVLLTPEILLKAGFEKMNLRPSDDEDWLKNYALDGVYKEGYNVFYSIGDFMLAG